VNFELEGDADRCTSRKVRGKRAWPVGARDTDTKALRNDGAKD
jgi:hypothetical protein